MPTGKDPRQMGKREVARLAQQCLKLFLAKHPGRDVKTVTPAELQSMVKEITGYALPLTEEGRRDQARYDEDPTSFTAFGYMPSGRRR